MLVTRGLASLIASGTRLWLDSVDPELVAAARAAGVSGATSNPVIIADLVKTGRFDARIAALVDGGADDDTVAWTLTDELVSDAQRVFLGVWENSGGNDGWVSFELDPLLEDPSSDLSHGERVARYVDLGLAWVKGQRNRMIKVPATPAGIGALEPLAAAGVPLNVTLLFTHRQYEAARDAVWRGASRLGSLDHFKSVYSIFVSRIDVWTGTHVPSLPPGAQGQLGIVNAKRIWAANRDFWEHHPTALDQSIVFASTGVKQARVDPCFYVEALAGADIQTNPPATNRAIEDSGRDFPRQIDSLPPAEVLHDLDSRVDTSAMGAALLEEGIAKFVSPQRDLLAIVRSRRRA
jgi:transaldolase